MSFTENGQYLGLDLGGTNYRVVLVKFIDGQADITIQNYAIPAPVLSGPSSGVSNYISILQWYRFTLQHFHKDIYTVYCAC